MDQVSLQDYCDEASSLIQSREFDRAINITRHILSHYPRHVESYRQLGQALLAAENYQEASKQFRRVLSADPEDAKARIGLGTIHEAAGDLDKALWQMWRAFDLSIGNADLRRQLRRMIEAYQGTKAKTLEITRAALGRIYARGGLYAKAIQEFKAVLAQDPKRLDIQIALAETLWRADHRLEAAEVCHEVLQQLPNALKANLIMAAMWLDSPQPDKAEPYLALAQALDPENIVVQSLLGDKSPLSPLSVKIERLSEVESEQPLLRATPTPPVEDAFLRPRLEPAVHWMSKSHEEEAAPMSSDEKREDEKFELPDWLQGVGDDLLEDDVQAEATTAAGASAEGAEEGTEDEAPEWLRNLVARTDEPAASKKPAGTPEDIPSTEPDDLPGWLQELRPETPEEVSDDASTPDWLAAVAAGRSLKDIEPSAAAEISEAAPTPTDSTTDQADWLGEAEEDEFEPEFEMPEEASEPIAEADEGRALWEQILVEEGVDLASAEEIRPPGAEGMAAEEWLRSTADQAAEKSVAPPKPPTEPPSSESEEEAEEPSIIEAPEPSVLEPMGDMFEDFDVPDWLREISAGEPVSPELAEPTVAESAAPTFPEAEIDEPGLPDWLREIQEPEPETAISPDLEEEQRKERVTADEVEVDESGLPDWLRQPMDGIEEHPGSEGLPVVEPPDWLKALESEEVPLGEPSIIEPTEMETGEMPEWLGQVMAEEGPLTEELAELDTTMPVEPETQEEQIPDWLREIRGETTDVRVEPIDEMVDMETPPPLKDEEGPELPDWLRRLREGIPEEAPPEPVDYLEGEAELAPTEAPIEAEAHLPTPWEEEEEVSPVEVSPEPETVEIEEAGPEWLGELVRDEESLKELEAIEEPVVPTKPAPPPVEQAEAKEAEIVSAAPPEPEPTEVPTPPRAARAPITTRHLEPLRVEDLPTDPGARLAMARATFNAGDWSEALLIYETLLTSSELLDEVIGDLEQGVSKHPDAAGYQLLGDAFMKDGRLQDALRSYRKALANL